jgi:exodeoxyribonuclease VII small subunit
MKKDLSTQSYEKLFSRLEEIVEDLEKGDLELERSIERYELGLALYRECSARLKQAEERVAKIAENSLRSDELEEFELPVELKEEQ